MKKGDTLEIEIKGIDPKTGAGVGFVGQKPIKTFGVIPGETVRVEIIGRKRNEARAKIVELISESPERILPKEDHFHSCGPWQIVPYATQLEWKKDMIRRMWSDESEMSFTEIIPSVSEYGYRNKLEFSVSENALAFHKRFSLYRYNLAPDGCALAPEPMNDVAKSYLETLYKNGFTDETIKNITVRQSFFDNAVIAVAFVTIPKLEKEIEFEHPNCSAYGIVFSNPLSPAAVSTEVLQQSAPPEITETVYGKKLTYGYDSFFQVNPPTFDMLLERVSKALPENTERVLDLYAGVGTIGFALFPDKNIVSVEMDEKASEYARRNAEQNNIQNVECIGLSSEKAPLEEYLKQSDIVIVDPPRAGMHKRVIAELVEHGPEYILYISCNPESQKRDITELKNAYQTTDWFLVDLYPQTPHIESVMLLNKK